VILESHSEHLLLRLQRRIAESRPPGTATSRELSSDKVKLFFAKADDGVSTLVPLDLDIFGNIRNWPDKFMGDAFNETSEAELARLRRMQAAK
jgi:hypothetical protein